MLALIPNLLTLSNLFCGSLGCIFALQNQVWWASQCIWLGALFDFLDGFAARMLRATSPLGAMLDSLADVVTFGVLPGLMLYQLLSIAPHPWPMRYWNFLGLLIPLSAAYRLARFNTMPATTRYFVGLPTPAVGLFVSFLPHLTFDSSILLQGLYSAHGLAALALGCTWLPISRVRFFTLKFTSLRQISWTQVLLVLCGAPLIIIYRLNGAAFTLLAYVVLSIATQARLRR